jgi:hypothetical protein
MHISAIATDFDGTVSQEDRLHPEMSRVLRRWRGAGHLAILVSGRPFDFLHQLQDREQLFDLIVAENGAVLYNPRTDEMRLPFGQVPYDLLDTLARSGVPLWRGVAIAGTRLPYDDAVWVASRELGLAVHVETNRNEVMILPPGASKGAGLLSLLKNEGLSPRNLLAFGDAENDQSFLQVAEVKVAVANAVEALKAIADYVTPEAGPAGVRDFIERYLLDGRSFDFPVRGAHKFRLGTENQIVLNAHDLVDRNVLIAGGSGYSKSWLASRLANGLIEGGYQLLVLDPVGDLHTLRRQASCLGLGRDETPPMNLAVQLLVETDLSLVLDLSSLSLPGAQVSYADALLRRVSKVRRRFGKPHWLLMDEAQDLIGGQDNPARPSLMQGLESPGVCLATWQPSRLGTALLDRIDAFVLTRHRLGSQVACLRDALSHRGLDVGDLGERLGQLAQGQALVWGLTGSAPASEQALTRLKFAVGPRIFPKMHRLHQLLKERVDRSLRFYFHDSADHPAPAGNLSELIDRLRRLDLDALAYHFRRGDFDRWIRDVLHDETLARWVDRLQATDLAGEELRQVLLDTLEQRRRMLERLT